MTRTISALRACSLFQAESIGTIRSLGRESEVFDVAAGRLLLVEGDPSNDLYVVLDGAVVVHANRLELAYLSAGEVVGEIGVVTGQPRSASVETIATSRILRIRGGQFRSAFQASRTLRMRTQDMVVGRSAGAAEATALRALAGVSTLETL